MEKYVDNIRLVRTREDLGSNALKNCNNIVISISEQNVGGESTAGERNERRLVEKEIRTLGESGDYAVIRNSFVDERDKIIPYLRVVRI